MALQRTRPQRLAEAHEPCRSNPDFSRILRRASHEPMAGHPCIHPRSAFRICILQDRIAQADDAHALCEQHHGPGAQPYSVTF